jgi:hypothetical protein
VSDLGELIDNIRHALTANDTSRDAIAALASPMDSSQTTMSLELASAGPAGAGLAEVGMEIMAVKSIDPSTGTATLWPFGRGYRSSTPAAHSAGVEVRLNPSWPSFTIARAINDAIREMYPSIYKVVIEETEIPEEYGPLFLNGNPAGVINVFVEDAAGSGEWVPEHRWDYNKNRSDDGYNLVIGGAYEAGRQVRVVYAAAPGEFSLTGSLTQEFSTETGLDPRHETLLLLAVAYRMAPFIDLARLPFLSAEAQATERGQGAGQSVGRLLYSMFQTRLREEAAILAKENPIRLHKVGR